MSRLFDGLFIFELANNHQGDVDHGIRIIREVAKVARRYGLRGAVKLQYRDLGSLIHPEFTQRDDIKHIPRFLSTALSEEQFRMLLDAARKEDLSTMITPFDEASVELAVAHGVDFLKVASCSATDWPLVEKIANTGHPIVASTGGLSLQDIDSVVSFYRNKNCRFALMHCVGLYPTPDQCIHMRFLSKLIKRFSDVPVGWSGHEAPDNHEPIKIASALGSRLFERHVGIAVPGTPLNKYSLSPEQLDACANALVAAQIIAGEDVKEVSQQELDSLRSLQRGVFVKRPVKKGEVIRREDVFFAMPCADGQTTSGEFGRYRTTFTASRDYEEGEAVNEYCPVDSVSRIRSIIHDVTGMLYEAQIALGADAEIELSHHNGIEQFRQTGATIISVVNREYCKKLLVVLPGQNHPSHSHTVKEETFQLLWGDLEVTLGDKTFLMTPGETILVERGQMHSFCSTNGAVLEEISTTHVKNDSYYEDERINMMDAIQRKSVLPAA